MAAFSAVSLLIFFCSAWSFLMASFFLGVARGTRMLVFAPSVKRLSRQEDATGYFAVAPIFTLPFSALLPLACGKFLDYYQPLGAQSYMIVFTMAFILISGALWFILNTDFSVEVKPSS